MVDMDSADRHTGTSPSTLSRRRRPALIEVAAFGQWPATNTVEDLTPECETGVEAAGGVFLRRTSGVTAENERRPGPELPLHRSNVPADVVRRADVVDSDNQNVAVGKSGAGVEILRQRLGMIGSRLSAGKCWQLKASVVMSFLRSRRQVRSPANFLM
ncbi:MAG: hypothetical protein ACK5DM_16395 [Planctomyces sp.]|jgi:hypothetical protein